MKEKINELIKQAMLSHNSVELRTFRLIKTEFGEFQNAKNAKVLNEVAEINILNKMIKERKDSIEKYTEANRLDLVKQEQEEIEVIKRFLPEDVSEEDLRNYVLHLVVVKGLYKMGDIIQQTKSKYPTADGKLLSDIIKIELYNNQNK